MQAAVEISMYPLRQDYEPPIIAFIQELKQNPDLRVHTNELSTQVAGDYDTVMNAIRDAMKSRFIQSGTCSFVLKVLNVDIAPGTSVAIS